MSDFRRSEWKEIVESAEALVLRVVRVRGLGRRMAEMREQFRAAALDVIA
jgi:hypothetical protein